MRSGHGTWTTALAASAAPVAVAIATTSSAFPTGGSWTNPIQWAAANPSSAANAASRSTSDPSAP
jgi:hypothetical protein